MAKKSYSVPALSQPQTDFCESDARVTLYGGARGGGKSFVVRVKAILLALFYPHIKIVIMRRTLVELKNNHFTEFQVALDGIAKWKAQDMEFQFENGSIIKFMYMNTDADWLKVQGQSIEVFFLDEATHFTEFMYMKIRQSNRLSGLVDVSLKLKPRIYLTANPGGVGHTWVKRLFIDKQYTPQENPNDYKFIPARVYDNQFIMDNDPEYVQYLEALPESERKAMLDGDWSVFEGQFFEEFDEELHTFDPELESIPENVKIYRTRDYGLDMLACYWVAIDETGTCWVYKGIEQSRLTVAESAVAINNLTTADEVIEKDICPPDMWNQNQQTGRSAIDILLDYGQMAYKSNNNREMGWLFLKGLLETNPKTNMPYLRISKRLTRLINAMKMIQHDEKKPNDCAKDPHDITHFPDALRYFAITYTYKAEKKPMVKKKKIFNEMDWILDEGDFEVKTDDDYYDLGGGYLYD